MRHLLRFSTVTLLAAVALPLTALGAYSDLPADPPASISIRILTDLGVVRGYDDGTFKPGQLVNRAEFAKIVTSLLGDPARPVSPSCFPDVPDDAWYARHVCLLKLHSLVSGHDLPGVPPERWPFKPADPVNYAEALKILTLLTDLPNDPYAGGEWYNRYLRAAESADVDLSEARPGDKLSRAQVARIVVAFHAESRGMGELLRSVLQGHAGYETLVEELSFDASSSSSSSSTTSSSSSSSSSSVSSSSSSSTSTSSSSSSSSVSGDPYGSTAIRAQFLLLGEVSPVLASVRLFENVEPLHVNSITVTLDTVATTVEAIRVYGDDGRFLGTASLDTTDGTHRAYKLNLPSGVLDLEKDEEYSIYVRAQLKDDDSGGSGGEIVKVASFTIRGTGEWSNNEYIRSSNDTFLAFETARATLTAFRNAGPEDAALSPGPGQLIGTFKVEARESDPAAEPRITTLRFQVGSSNVTLSEVRLRADGADTSFPCVLAGSIITCAGLDPQYGVIGPEGRTFSVYADVELATTAGSQFLRLTVNQAGTPADAGAVSWTDGATTFDWLPFDTPVAQGTLYDN